MNAKVLSPSRTATLAVLLSLLLSGAAQAHVKWFCGPIDSSIAPAPPQQVLSPTFLLAALLFTALVAAGGLVDALLARLVPGAAAKFSKNYLIGEIVLRLGMSAYAFCLWQNLAVVLWADTSSASILTPDLLGRGPLTAFLQLAIAIMVLIPRASIVTGIALAVLYAAGVEHYGAFYMIDYLFFPGAAAYIALSDPWLKRYPRVADRRIAILTVSVSLMWTAVEKFLFPQWTISVLVHHPGITAGLPFDTVTVIAGFIEFSLAFYLLVGREILIRLSMVLLMGLFVVAMPEFGMVDVIGHISVITIFLVLILHGETQLQQVFRKGQSGVFASSARVAMLYLVALTGLTLLYYGLHALSVWA